MREGGACWARSQATDSTYAIQHHVDVSACVNDGMLAAQLNDFP